MMIKQTLVLFIASIVLVTAGCAGSKKATSQQKTAKSSAALASQNAAVYVEGEYRVTTPATVRIRRSFGEAAVMLKRGNDVIRRFEVEPTHTSSSSDLAFGYQGQREGGIPTFDLMSLSQRKDGSYVIPYFSVPIQIVDRTNGLTLLVTE